MTIDAETNTGESVLKHKCLGFGCSMEFIKTQGRFNHHNFCLLYKKSIEEKIQIKNSTRIYKQSSQVFQIYPRIENFCQKKFKKSQD